jgi:hypothetical protein
MKEVTHKPIACERAVQWTRDGDLRKRIVENIFQDSGSIFRRTPVLDISLEDNAYTLFNVLCPVIYCETGETGTKGKINVTE